MAHWMKDVLQDLGEFCEHNRLQEIQKSLIEAEKVLDEEIRRRENGDWLPEVNLANTGS